MVGPGAPTVLLEQLPGCVAGDVCACAGPPNVAIATSATVLFSGEPAVRVGDSTAHGGVIIAGAASVLVGD